MAATIVSPVEVAQVTTQPCQRPLRWAAMGAAAAFARRETSADARRVARENILAD